MMPKFYQNYKIAYHIEYNTFYKKNTLVFFRYCDLYIKARIKFINVLYEKSFEQLRN